MMNQDSQSKKTLFIITTIVIIGLFFALIAYSKNTISSDDVKKDTQEKASEENIEISTRGGVPVAIPVDPSIHYPNRNVEHIETPVPVRAVYMSNWVASGGKMKSDIIKLIDDTEVNAVVIDIKDATGKVAFLTDDETVNDTGSPENRVRDIAQLIDTLHEKNIYVIGRIAVFQDPYLAAKYPEWAIHRKSDGEVWKDKKGLSFLDVTNEEVGNYIIALARESHRIGFDEINFDYIRFPSDGDIANISYPLTKYPTRADALEDFFKRLHIGIEDSGMVTSADLFGLVTSTTDDMGIGQVLERTLPYFDYIAPMVYPSHYPKNFIGLANPATEPYKVIKYAMDSGVTRIEAAGFSKTKLRPWLQDFNMGATYTADMVRAQMQATYDAGLDSWMMWDPANTYTNGAYLAQ
ncbi:MAG: putative glycoside hydrolase [Candidatus Pacebacteria bacterium]|nr:putative glycoside hydrolase [Candidatus Paceibacterota bacterium]